MLRQAASCRALVQACRLLGPGVPEGVPALQAAGFLPAAAPATQLPVSRAFIGLPSPFETGESKKFHEQKVLPYTPEEIYDVVAAVEHYHEFVPWCVRSVITARRPPNYLEAELEVGFQMFTERYISRVTLHPGQAISSSVGDSTLFRYLNNEWRFAPGPHPGSSRLDFSVDFAFKSALYRHLANVFFAERHGW
ncbi:Coenzyme Q-binding protein COQ10-like protein B, mitochondrial [Auxenochlorella protothecoides]|uniref:Coenzyme Q-binding protein COQ10-like protein B, mitochondrial n=1 Tax=Auxenochlorella protothecoides TaxID=3075 RepID=A0A087SSN5_AUXPR|nr:Coenzyme Q-binding protein COQ10-like protein B, mitochondrial [Auxenochlorella protothecoides]KFM28739.1 Coenzyme Q-binding protein COQ10-like protein B, mitochondrial [Auxenochlorella protothecoides]